MYLLVIMHVLLPARKLKIFFVCTILNLAPVNLTINTKTMLSTVLGISKMSLITSSLSLVPLITFHTLPHVCSIHLFHVCSIHPQYHCQQQYW